jgi:hypothetical protein
VNGDNDILNCGQCGEVCTGPHPYCDKGVCGTPPCEATCAAGICCGQQCCADGQLCCTVPGPVVMMYPACISPGSGGTCPAGCTACRCNPEGTRIAGPGGSRAIETLVEGDLVYSVDRGRLAVVPVKRTNRVAVRDHVMVRVVFAGGAVLRESPRHPTADGRSFGELGAGDAIDGLRIVEVSRVRYEGSATWDILPDSDTGTYFADGVLVGSTLSPAPAHVAPGLAPACVAPTAR